MAVAASTAEDAVDPEHIQKTADRLQKVFEERQHWIGKREELLKRKNKLLKLLQLQEPKYLNNEQIEPQKALQEAQLGQENNDELRKVAAVDLARKKELKELQARAEAAQAKQQATATVLAHRLKQLLVKRKREDQETNEPPRKKAEVTSKNKVKAVAIASKIHPFAFAPDLDVGTTELAKAACFRIAMRHFVQTGMIISRQNLEQAFKTYTGKVLKELMDCSSLKYFLTELLSKDTQNLSKSARKTSVSWRPGRQFLKTPTFVSSNSERIQKMIELEKDVVASICDSLDSLGHKIPAVVQRRRQEIFFGNVLDDSFKTPSPTMLLFAFIGVNPAKAVTGHRSRIFYRLHAQLADVLEKADTWLCEQAEVTESHCSLLPKFDGQTGSRAIRERFASSSYTKPFSVANDSVVRQLNQGALQPICSKTIDPMKIVCRYELNGVCNDKNCSDYHQKDYQPVNGERNNISEGDDEHDDDGGITVEKMDEMDQLLMSFAAFRARIIIKWPVVSTTRTLSTCTKTAKLRKIGKSIASDLPLSNDADAAALAMQDFKDSFENDSDDFIALDSKEEVPSVGDARYFDQIDSRKLYGELLQAKVEKNPTATDAWLLLAIFQLELVIKLRDDAVNLSDDEYLQQQLLLLCKELNHMPHCSTSRTWAIEEANLKQCLHTLSRALEVEANAYCEALWLLYLHLCKQVTSQQTEIDMVEHGVQFLPNSQALWLRYISKYDFESVSAMEEIHWRLLEHLAQTRSAESGSKISKSLTKDVSILLTAISLNLCIKLWHAGATSRVFDLLSALLQLGDQPSEFAWCSVVRSQIRPNEVIVFSMIFAHFLLFHDIPELIEHWVAASCSGCIPIKELAYTPDSLRDRGCDIEAAVLSRALTCYELAFQVVDTDSDTMRDAGNVILSNWMLLLALQPDDKQNESLSAYFLTNLATIQQFPGASLTAAKLMAVESTGGQEAQQLMLTMMKQSSNAHFPEALHYYLFACRQTPALVDALDNIFPDIMERLASFVDVNVEQVKRSIQDIMHDTSKIGKSRALNDLLKALLGAWMDQLVFLRQESTQHIFEDKQKKSFGNVYVALNICHLMGVLLEISVAVDGIQMILSSPCFGALSYEARQLAWMQRFVYQVDLLQQEEPTSYSWRQRQVKLTNLFRKYMLEMSVETETMCQVSRQVKISIAKNSVEDALCDCLNPERRHLFTYSANLELFRLCSAAIAGPDKAAFYASCADLFALSPEFSLTFSDIATQEWELLAARTSLRKCLSGAKTQHSKVLQALVAVDLRLKNMKAISSLLKSEIQLNPLLLEPWRLAVAFEVLVGEKSDGRSQIIADEIEKRQLVFTCNTFGDNQISDQNGAFWDKEIDDTSLSLRGVGLGYVPTSVLLRDKLVSLDISGNQLLELPMGLRYLTNLQQLNASENALLEFPACVKSLIELKDLRLAHNNISMFPLPILPRLNKIDIRWNIAAQLLASNVVALTNLKAIQAEENLISLDELSLISDLLSSREHVLPPNAVSKNTRGHLNEQKEEQPDDSATKQPTHANLTESLPADVTDASCLNIIAPSIVTNDVRTAHTTTDDDGDQKMEKECALTTSTSGEVDGGTMVISNEANVTYRPESDENTIMVDNNCHFPSVSNELHDDQNMIIKKPVLADYSITPSTPVNNAAECANELQCFLPTLTGDNLLAADIAEMKSFAQDFTEVAKSTDVRRQLSQDKALLARRRLTTYMDQNDFNNRAEVRYRNPTLWREFLAANIPMNLELPGCRLCLTPNDGYNQRFNSIVLCVTCLEDAILVLKEQTEQFDDSEDTV